VRAKQFSFQYLQSYIRDLKSCHQPLLRSNRMPLPDNLLHQVLGIGPLDGHRILYRLVRHPGGLWATICNAEIAMMTLVRSRRAEQQTSEADRRLESSVGL
jgi:hypothetical protein